MRGEDQAGQNQQSPRDQTIRGCRTVPEQEDDPEQREHAAHEQAEFAQFARGRF